jgi:Zn-finger nucleic acid-binding protein
MTKNDVVDVLTAVAVGDRRTVGKNDVELWFRVIGDLQKDLTMQAVVDHFTECPGVWLEPGHIVQRVRAIRRDAYERESDMERAYRQDAQAVKAADEVRSLAAAAVPGPTTKKTPRLRKAEDALALCRGKRECQAALTEYFAARAEIHRPKTKQAS